jgi:hypothetical protein
MCVNSTFENGEDMERGDPLIVWLHENAARLFLGLPLPIRDQTQEASKIRWCILGTFVEEPSPVGMWLDVQVLQEREGDQVVRNWMVDPPTCLVRWEFIIHAQRGNVPKKGAMGFIPAA